MDVVDVVPLRVAYQRAWTSAHTAGDDARVRSLLHGLHLHIEHSSNTDPKWAVLRELVSKELMSKADAKVRAAEMARVVEQDAIRLVQSMDGSWRLDATDAGGASGGISAPALRREPPAADEREGVAADEREGEADGEGGADGEARRPAHPELTPQEAGLAKLTPQEAKLAKFWMSL